MSWRFLFGIEYEADPFQKLKVFLYFCAACLAALSASFFTSPTPFQLKTLGLVSGIGFGVVALHVSFIKASIGWPVLQLSLKTVFVVGVTGSGFYLPTQVHIGVQSLLASPFNTSSSRLAPPVEPVSTTSNLQTIILGRPEQAGKDHENHEFTFGQGAATTGIPPAPVLQSANPQWIYRRLGDKSEKTVWSYARSQRDGKLVAGVVSYRDIRCDWFSRPIYCEKSDKCAIPLSENKDEILAAMSHLEEQRAKDDSKELRDKLSHFEQMIFDLPMQLDPKEMETQLAESKDRPLDECSGFASEKFSVCKLATHNPYPERGFAFECEGQGVFADYYYQTLRLEGDQEVYTPNMRVRLWPP